MKRVDLDEVERKFIVACADNSKNMQVAEAISAMIAEMPSMIHELRLLRRFERDVKMIVMPDQAEGDDPDIAWTIERMRKALEAME